jgi:hypothetical protein
MSNYKHIALLACAALFSACESSPSAPKAVSGPTVEPVEYNVTSSENGAPAQKLTYKVGPFSLPAGQKAVTMWEAPGSINFQTEEPLWVTSFEHDIEEAGGNELPPDLLHMAIVSNSGETNPLCTDKETANPFFAATSASPKIELPDGAGYAVLPTDQLDAKVVLQNPTTQDFNNVYFKFTISAVPMKGAKNIKDTVPLLFEADPCGHAPMSVPPKEFSKKEAEFELPQDGIFTKAYGLLQDYGVSVSLTSNGQAAPFWEGKTTVSEGHKVKTLPVYDDPAGITFKSGDRITFEAAYDNPSDNWQSSATGAVMAYMIRTGEEDAPAKEVPASKAAVDAASAQKALLGARLAEPSAQDVP